jgi:hypothetical protein
MNGNMITSTARSRKATNFQQLMVMGGEVLWTVSFACCFFVFLQVKSDGIVIGLLALLMLGIGYYFLVLNVQGVLHCCLDNVYYGDLRDIV